MIKEKKKKKKPKVTLAQEFAGYAKTVCISFFIAVIFSVMLTMQARNAMIKNLYSAKNSKSQLEMKIAKKIVENSDFTSTLHDKSYFIAMQVGELYETAGELNKAEYAYHIAVNKRPASKYLAYQKLATVLIAQGKTEAAEELINEVMDTTNLSLIRFKTRTNIILGDKYYSEGKFLKAADSYEKAQYYYNRLKKKDRVVQESIRKRLIKSYLGAAAVIVKNGYNSDAVRFLKKALKYDPNNLKIQYRLAIVYADLDPIISVEYFEPLIAKIPQEIDRDIYSKVLIKAANIMDIQGNSIKAKYYRYKIHSLDLYVNNKVIYKEDVEVLLDAFKITKFLFTYKLKSKYTIKNVSATDINKLAVDFVLRKDDEIRESKSFVCATKRKPLYSNGGEIKDIAVNFGKNIYTKHELNEYFIDIYLYKEAKYKTLVGSYKIPVNNFKSGF